MFKNVASQKLIVFAFDATTNLPKTGDAANLTAYVSKDYGAVTVLGDTSAAEMDATNAKGYYLFDLTQAETNADVLIFSGKSSTANIVIIGVPARVDTGVQLGNVAHGGVAAVATIERLVVASTTANEPGVKITGNGTGPGLLSTGGASGNGVTFVGGATLGYGAQITATASGYTGLYLLGIGGGFGALIAGGATGHGIYASGGGGAAAGIFSIGGGSGPGIEATGSSSGPGIKAAGGATGNAVTIVGGGTSGMGISITTSSGDGFKSAPLLGHALNLAANGTSKHGMLITGGTAGTSDGISVVAGSGGVPIRGDILGNLVGTVSTITTYTGNTPQTGDSFALIGATGSGLTSLATQASVNAIDDFLDTEVAAILAAVDTEVAAIKAKTDSLNFTVAGVVDANMLRISDDAVAANNLESMLDGTGGAVLSLGQLSIVNNGGDAFFISSTTGHGINITVAGDNKHGIFVTGGTGGVSDGIKVVAGFGGVDIRGNITGNLVGTVSTLTTYTGNTPQTGDVFPLASTEIADIKAKTDLIPATPASTTNITAGVITTVTNLTNAPTAGDFTAAMKAATLARVTLVDTTTTNTDMRGTDSAALASVWTSTRGGYLDNLNVGGLVASSAEVTSVQNNTRVVRVVPNVIERPDSGTVTYRVELLLYDAVGNMEAPDAAPTIALVNQAGTDLSARLDSATMALVSTGRYRAIYTASVGDALEQLVWTFSVIEGGATRLYGNASLIVDTSAVDFTAADRTDLQTVLARADVATSTRMATYTQPTGFLAATFPTDPADQSLIIAATDAVMTRIGAAGAGLTALGDTRIANLDATVSGRMATYVQPTGFLAATFPSGTVANTTNITAGTITTVTNLTNAPTAGDLTSTMKTSVQTAAEAGLVTHRLDELLNADSDIDGAAPPTVGSVVHEMLTKTTGSFTFDQTTDSLEAIRDNQSAGAADWTSAEREQIRHRIGIDGTATLPSTGTPSLATTANQTTIINRLGAITGSGINTVLGFFRALAGKLGGLTPTDLTGGSVTFDNTTDSLEALRDRGDAAWITGSTAGSGSEIVNITIKDTASNPIDGVSVWITTDSAGANVVAGTHVSNSFGVVPSFFLNPGVYFRWARLSGRNFSNPQSLTVV